MDIPMQTAINRPYDRTSHILVVDDDQSLLKFFKIHLNKFFSKVIVVENAMQAVKELGEKEIALVISDVRMPKVDGTQLMKKVRKKDPAIPFLLISGEVLSEDQEVRIKDSDGFLRKPFSIDEFHQFVSHGMSLHDAYLELCTLIKDKKNFRKLIQGKVKTERMFPKTEVKKAQQILLKIKKAA